MGYFENTEFQWKDDKKTYAFILNKEPAHQRIYYITAQEEFDVIQKIMQNKYYTWTFKVFDENGDLIEKYKSDHSGLTFADYEVKLDKIDTTYDELVELIKKLDAEIKHQEKLARKRELYRRKVWKKRNPTRIKLFKDDEEES